MCQPNWKTYSYIRGSKMDTHRLAVSHTNEILWSSVPMDTFTKHSYTQGSENIAKDEDGVERL